MVSAEDYAVSQQHYCELHVPANSPSHFSYNTSQQRLPYFASARLMSTCSGACGNSTFSRQQQWTAHALIHPAALTSLLLLLLSFTTARRSAVASLESSKLRSLSRFRESVCGVRLRGKNPCMDESAPLPYVASASCAECDKQLDPACACAPQSSCNHSLRSARWHGDLAGIFRESLGSQRGSSGWRTQSLQKKKGNALVGTLKRGSTGGRAATTVMLSKCTLCTLMLRMKARTSHICCCC